MATMIFSEYRLAFERQQHISLTEQQAVVDRPPIGKYGESRYIAVSYSDRVVMAMKQY